MKNRLIQLKRRENPLGNCELNQAQENCDYQSISLLDIVYQSSYTAGKKISILCLWHLFFSDFRCEQNFKLHIRMKVYFTF